MVKVDGHCLYLRAFLIDRQRTIVYAEINADDAHRMDLGGLHRIDGLQRQASGP